MIDKDQILHWLQNYNLKPTEQTADNADWLIRIIFQDYPVVIVNPKGESRIVIQRALLSSDEGLTIIRDASLNDRQEFINSLKHDLLLSHTKYKMKFEDEDVGTILQSLVLENYIYEDGISQDKLFQRIHEIHDATILFFLLIQKYKFGSQ